MLSVLTTVLLLGSLPAQIASGQGIPQELFSPLSPQKVLATYRASPSQQWPQFTDGAGKWEFYPPRTWTSGFFPTTLYALNTRRQLCGATDANQLGIADWLALGRANSRGLPLDAGGGVGHDVGFMSFPFVEELAMYVLLLLLLLPFSLFPPKLLSCEEILECVY